MKTALPITEKSNLGSNQGIVIARVVDTRHLSAPFNSLTITPKNVNASKSVKFIKMESKPGVPGRTVLFLSHIDAGEYSISGMKARYIGGGYTYDFSVPTDVSLGSFKVEPGRITDLGTLIYYPKLEGSEYRKVLARSPTAGDKKSIVRYFPFLKDMLEHVGGWNEDGLDDDRSTLYSSIIQNPVSYSRSYKSPNGNIYFLGAFGTLVKRAENGDWEFDAIDTDYGVSAIVEGENGDLIVGGEQGTVMIKRPGDNWSDISLDVGYVVDDLTIVKHGIVDAVVRSFNRIYIYRMDYRKTKLKWNKLASFVPFLGWHDSQDQATGIGVKKPRYSHERRRIASSSLDIVGNQHYISISTRKVIKKYENEVSENSLLQPARYTLFSYDPATWEMSMASKPDSKFHDFVIGGKTVLGVKKKYFSLAQNSFWRKDKKENRWKEVLPWIEGCSPDEDSFEEYGAVDKEKADCMKSNNRMVLANKVRPFKKRHFDFSSRPIFTSDLEGHAIVTFYSHQNSTGLSQNIGHGLVRTFDGGSSWSEVEVVLPGRFCVDLIPLLVNPMLLSCKGTAGDFYESYDFGNTWNHVREHENF